MSISTVRGQNAAHWLGLPAIHVTAKHGWNALLLAISTHHALPNIGTAPRLGRANRGNTMDQLQRDLNTQARRKALCMKVERLSMKVTTIGRNQWRLFYRVARASHFTAAKLLSDMPRDQALLFWYALNQLDRANKRYVDWLAVREAASRAGIAPSICFRGTHGE